MADSLSINKDLSFMHELSIGIYANSNKAIIDFINAQDEPDFSPKESKIFMPRGACMGISIRQGSDAAYKRKLAYHTVNQYRTIQLSKGFAKPPTILKMKRKPWRRKEKG